MNLKPLALALCLTGSAAYAGVCTNIPGSVTCSKGTVDNLNGNGSATVNGTTVSGPTHVNGMLTADDANFYTLEVNGSAKLSQCTINQFASIKGSLVASSTKFEKSLEIFSSETRFINSKVGGDLHLGHTDSKKQVVYLDNFSEITGNVIFDDGEGEVILRGDSKIGGKVVGGQALNK